MSSSTAPSTSPSSSSSPDNRANTHSRMRSAPPSPTQTPPPPDQPINDINNTDDADSTLALRQQDVTLSKPLLNLLRLFSQLPRGVVSDAEIVDFDISQKQLTLLWRLLGLGSENEGEWSTSPSLLSLSPYLAILRAHHLPSSEKKLQELGRWLLDSLHCDLVSQVDAAGTTYTQLWVRMPSPLHDRVVGDFGQLLRDVIKPVVAGEEVRTASMALVFPSTTQELPPPMYTRTITNAQASSQTEVEPRAQEESEQQFVVITSSTRQTRAMTRKAQANQTEVGARTQEASQQQQSAITPNASAPENVQDSETQQKQRVQGKKQYDTAYPDICILVGDPLENIYPSMIVEVGFSHPLPFRRVYDYINHGKGRCRIVLLLNLEYHEKNHRLQLYQCNQLPPDYHISLHLFRCNIKAAGEYNTYIVQHELRDINVREAAQHGKTLDLRLSDLKCLEDDDGAASTDQVIKIPYNDLVQIVNKAAWVQARYDNRSLAPEKERERPLIRQA